MTYRHCSVIDADDRYITYVLVLNDKVQHYTLSEGERLIDANPPVWKQQIRDAGFIVPKWDGEEWTEGATSQEISAWEAEHPAMPEPEPTEQEQLRADVDFLLAMGGVL